MSEDRKVLTKAEWEKCKERGLLATGWIDSFDDGVCLSPSWIALVDALFEFKSRIRSRYSETYPHDSTCAEEVIAEIDDIAKELGLE